MAKTPPRRSYRLFSDLVSLACAYARSAPVNAAGTVVSASPATALRLVMEVKRGRAMGQLLGVCAGQCLPLRRPQAVPRWAHLIGRIDARQHRADTACSVVKI